jgi:hypothetical protein
MGRDRKSLEEQVRKKLHCFDQSIRGNFDEGSEENSKESLELLRD